MFKKIIFTLHLCEKITTDSKKKQKKRLHFFLFSELYFNFFLLYSKTTEKNMPYLLFDENGTLHYIQLEQEFLLTFGCTPDCNIILPPGNCPHFRILNHGNAWFFEDLTSAAPGAHTPLANGDRITLNGLVIKFLDSVTETGAKPFPGVIALSSGQKLGGYTITNQQNKMENSRFYLATNADSKSFGIKVFSKNTTGEEQELFLHEMNRLHACSLPGSLAPYHDFGVIRANCYYATDYYESPSLTFRISSKAPMRQLEALSIIYDISEILRDAFQATGTFHGALTPSNILYDADEKMKLSEFGLFYWKSVTLTGGHPCVSPWYISPEAVSGGEISIQSDMYALGIMLFQMLTGILPFHSHQEAELFRMHLTQPFPLPEERNPNISVTAGTLQLLLKLTAKDPANRFGSWDELLKALDYAASSRQLEIRRKTPVSEATLKSTLQLKSRIQ